jgi:GT2 family glycosyltransferase
MMNVCCVLVTYGNRALYVQRLVNEALKQGVSKIIVVDNGSTEESRIILDKLVFEKAPFIDLVSLGTNSGSAKGFSSGIRAALKTDTEICWLLDDDNLPEAGAVEELRKEWNAITVTNKNVSKALSSFRKGRNNFIRAAKEKDPAAVLPPPNSFMGFHIKSLFALIKHRFIQKGDDVDFEEGVFEINACAYGGFWFHKDLCSAIGFPDEDYILYMDDFDYTYRLKLKGGQILMVSRSLISEMETSYYMPPKKSIYYHSLLEARSEAIAYYTCRNIVFFTHRHLLTNRSVYGINKIIFILMISTLGALRGKFQRLRTIYHALADGESGRMGLRRGYTLAK